MIETGRMMVLHSVVIGILLYIFMKFILGQKSVIAENRSILLAALILIYMILFGHGLPKSINRNVFEPKSCTKLEGLTSPWIIPQS